MQRWSRRASLLVVSFASLAAAPRTLPAQAPWAVTMRPEMNPVPIGRCSDIALTIRDLDGKSTPQNGIRRSVTISEFDMRVESATPQAGVGRYAPASFFSACVCPAAKVGEQATVTATYPARSLDEKVRVPGVAFQSKILISFMPSQAKFNPPECDAL